MFSSPVSIRLSSGTSRSRLWAAEAGAVADLDRVHLADIRLDHAADRVGEVVAQALALGADVAAEDRLDADLLRRDGVEAGERARRSEGASAAAISAEAACRRRAAARRRRASRRAGGPGRAAAGPRGRAASCRHRHRRRPRGRRHCRRRPAPGPSPVAATAAALIAPRHARRSLPPVRARRASDPRCLNGHARPPGPRPAGSASGDPARRWPRAVR